MRTSELFTTKYSVLILLGVWIFCATGCDNPDYQGLEDPDTITNQQPADWVSMMEEINIESSILVTKENSIQEALDAARPGDAIYIEAGTYREGLKINKANIKLIGLNGSDGEGVFLENPVREENAISIAENGRGLEVINVNYQNNKDVGQNIRHGRLNQSRLRSHILSMTRTDLGSGIAHYQFLMRVGKREFDVIRLHRVVREHRPHHPMQTDGAIFMIHGSIQDFDDIFLRPGVTYPDAQNSSPVYLAANYIDVWGIDLAWTLVPAETTDLSFMQDWGVERDVDHTLSAMAMARLIRGLTGQGLDRMNLLGFSYGVAVAYAATGRETQQYPIMRDIKGLVAAEGAMKYAPEDEESRVAGCNSAAGNQEQINSGIYSNTTGLFFGLVGDLAATAPEEPSEIVPGFTNFQTSLFFGTSTFALGDPPAPFWHFLGGDFNENGIPVGLLYTDPGRWIELIRFLAPHQPFLSSLDLNNCLCNEEDVTIDDHLGKISVPIFYLGVEGGFGPQGEFTSSLTRSKDIRHHIVKLQPDELRVIDFGHADMFMGEDASKLVWEILRKWLVDHSHRYKAS